MAGTKRLTNREKQGRAVLRQQLQEKGVLPPDKPRLNREKFIGEAEAEWDGRDKECILWDLYLMEALSYMLGHRGRDLRLSLEAVGAAKVLKLAVRLRKFGEELKARGEKKYKLTDQYDYIRDILDA